MNVIQAVPTIDGDDVTEEDMTAQPPSALFPALAGPVGITVLQSAMDDVADTEPVIVHASVPVRRSPSYQARGVGLVWLKPTRDATVSVPVPLTNFTARIVEDCIEDDEAEEHRYYTIEADIQGKTRHIQVPAEDFASLNWVPSQLGASAIVCAGAGYKERVREAIQAVSTYILERRVFAHLGWRQIDGEWVYLHAGGAISADGPVPGIQVALAGTLGLYQLPKADASRDSIVEAVRASLRLLDLAPAEIIFPLYAAIWRSVLGVQVDFGLYLSGSSGVGKSELAARLLQHFGSGLDARHFPAGWSSTGNALEAIAFAAKDALLVIDDYAPTGSVQDVKRMQQSADRLFRGLGNNTGRSRLRADASIKADKPPRALVIATGEDVPPGQSLRARMFVVELSPRDLRFDVLTACQQDGEAGLYATAMSEFVMFIAQRFDEFQKGVPQLIADFRRDADESGQHRRTPMILGNLMTGFAIFLSFAEEIGAIDEQVRDDLWDRCWEALKAAAAKQGMHHIVHEPAEQFLDLLRSVLSSGRAHLATTSGDRPEQPGSWGWQWSNVDLWRPQGNRIGWIDGKDLYLDPNVAYAEVHRLGQESGRPLTVSEGLLPKRLDEKGLLASTEKETRGTFMVRRTVEGSRRVCLHLKLRWLSDPDGDAEVVDDPAYLDAPF